MKYLAHIPTERFGFISFELEGTAEEVLTSYREVTDLVRLPKYGAGMEEKKYNEIIDLMIAQKPMQFDPGELEEMNSLQRFAFDIARKSLGRIKYKNR